MSKRTVVSVSWQTLFPAFTGGQLRSYHLVSRLRNLDVLILGPDGKVGDLPARRILDLDILGLYRLFRNLHSFDVFGFRIVDPVYFLGIIWGILLKRPEIVIADSHIVFLPCLIASRLAGARLILNSHNLLHVLHGKKNRIIRHGLRLFERLVFTLCDHVMVCSETERLHCRRSMKIPAWKIVTVPNGVELPSKAMKGPPSPGPYQEVLQGKARKLIFVGKLSYGPNREAVRFIEKRLAPCYESRDTLFMIIGKKPSWKQSYRNVVFTGFVEDLRPFYEAADAAVVPIFSGSGTRLKIIEYAAHGIPVVSTQKGCEGLDLDGIRIAETDTEFRQRIDEILASPRTRLEPLRRSARKYDWDLIAADFERFLLSLPSMKHPA